MYKGPRGIRLVFHGTLVTRIAVNQAEGPVPARLDEEILRDVEKMVPSDGGILQLVAGRRVGPVNNQRLADDVLARHKAPVAAVERRIAVISHGENGAGGNYDFAADRVILQH